MNNKQFNRNCDPLIPLIIRRGLPRLNLTHGNE